MVGGTPATVGRCAVQLPSAPVASVFSHPLLWARGRIPVLSGGPDLHTSDKPLLMDKCWGYLSFTSKPNSARQLFSLAVVHCGVKNGGRERVKTGWGGEASGFASAEPPARVISESIASQRPISSLGKWGGLIPRQGLIHSNSRHF